jgi:ubiquinone/menaquinone biosynthesis C-methylase UbiE
MANKKKRSINAASSGVFDRWAKHYDRAVRKEDDWMYRDYNKILDKVIEHAGNNLKGLLVLDIGSGTGNLTQKLLDQEAKAIGIDPSLKMRQIAQKKCPQAEFRAGHFLDIPMPKQSIDIIVSSFAFHHLTSQEKVLALTAMKKVLKSGGRIVIADLMFKNQGAEGKIKASLRTKGKVGIVEEIEDEYFSHLDRIKKELSHLGFQTKEERITPFVWIIAGILKPKRK